MKQIGKTIQIYLPDGNPRSLKIAEITSRTVSAILIPRSKLDEAFKRDELNNVGVYLLFGSDESKPQVYIGEAENCLSRLKQHNKSKDFWTHAVAFISKTQYFTKTHIKFLEWFCCEVATKANRYSLENGNAPSKPHVSESVEADLYDNFETIKILASTLGYPVFDEIRKPKTIEVIICKGKDAYAEGEYTEDGIIVFANSKCNLIESKTAGNWVVGMRSDLKESGVLAEIDGVLVFTKDHVFSSPSASAAVVLARRANGWIEWKYKDGKTLDEVKRQAS
ncbi:GIY-YIG nuclease family protein [Methylomonas sp. AM2-LC]|uniref:GIY-YIG nuclease family protein n=1 Tax=Methylomonas sp. AM2-LC TaxID=3153301 RepID=UPI0032664417